MYKTDFKSSTLWGSAFEGRRPSGSEADSKARLERAYDRFREKAAVLAGEIARDLPNLTDHSVHHLDALWVLASEIGGPDYRITPVEAFVLGGAILLHDLANSLVAYPNRVDGLRGPEWDDHVVSIFLRTKGKRPSPAELQNPPEVVRNEVIFARLRDVHATAAVRLATQGFVGGDSKQDRHYLIEDEELRDAYGSLIGRIANSHHWSIQRVEEEFASFRVSGTAWHGWEVDALKLACLLRCADACHLDVHRASSLLMALRIPAGVSKQHWKFQNRLHPAAMNATTGELEFRSTKPFGREDREAWWLAYEMIRTWADGELRSASRVLRRNDRPSFRATGAAAADDPEAFSRFVETEGWEPIDISVRITDVASVVERFGGRQLYGSNAKAPLRELIANAADAVRARRNVPDGGLEASQGSLVVRIVEDGTNAWLEVEDEGIGMSENVLRGPLLDFGSSFWASPMATREFPGLLSSNFRPTGKFGIGFFSVFMLGGAIKVTTRRFDAGSLDTQVLELTRGFRYPMLRRRDVGSKDESLPRGGTRVKICLDDDPWENGGVVGNVAVPNGASADVRASARLESLRKLVAGLAPAIDVDVWVEVAGKRASAATASDWTGLDFEVLLDRLGAQQAYQNARKVSQYVCEPSRDGVLLGRFRLVGDSYYGARKTMAIGGLAASWAREGVEGVVLGGSPQLSRDGGESLLTDQEFDEQLRAAVAHGFASNHPTSPKLATFLLGRKIVPKGLRCYVTSDEDLDIDGLIEHASTLEPGEELILIEDESFKYENELGGSEDYDVSDVWDRLDLEGPRVIIARGEKQPGWMWEPMASAPQSWAPGEPPPTTLLQFAALSACHAWGVSLDDVQAGTRKHTVGKLPLRNGDDFYVEVNAYFLVRPEPPDEDEDE